LWEKRRGVPAGPNARLTLGRSFWLSKGLLGVEDAFSFTRSRSREKAYALGGDVTSFQQCRRPPPPEEGVGGDREKGEKAVVSPIRSLGRGWDLNSTHGFLGNKGGGGYGLSMGKREICAGDCRGMERGEGSLI